MRECKYTPKELLCRYSTLWLPQHKKRKNMSNSEALAEDMVEAFLATKEGKEQAELCRQKYIAQQVEEDIEKYIMTKALVNAKGGKGYWEESERIQKKLDACYAELIELGQENVS